MAVSKLAQVPKEKLPVHIGLIMDGNGRWAAKRGLPRTVGHKQGADTFGKIVQYCKKLGIRYLTVYAFSTENWKRPPEEIQALMKLLRDYLEELFKHPKEDACLHFLGDKTALDLDIQERMERLERESAGRTGITVNVAFNYGGREEIMHAARQFARDCMDGKCSPDEINEERFSQYLYTKNQPDPDLIIRPSGEQRTSNFLPWQSVYAELVFMDVLWPDFTPDCLDEAILEYLQRARRFGGV